MTFDLGQGRRDIFSTQWKKLYVTVFGWVGLYIFHTHLPNTAATNHMWLFKCKSELIEDKIKNFVQL